MDKARDKVRKARDWIREHPKNVKVVLITLLTLFFFFTVVSLATTISVSIGINDLKETKSNDTDVEKSKIQSYVDWTFWSLLVSLGLSMITNMILFFTKKNKKRICLKHHFRYSFTFLIIVGVHMVTAVVFVFKVKGNDSVIYEVGSPTQIPLRIDQLFSGTLNTKFTVIGTHYLFILKIFLELLEKIFLYFFGRSVSEPSSRTGSTTIPSIKPPLDSENPSEVPTDLTKPLNEQIQAFSHADVRIYIDETKNAETHDRSEAIQYSTVDEESKIASIKLPASDEDENLHSVQIHAGPSTTPKSSSAF